MGAVATDSSFPAEYVLCIGGFYPLTIQAAPECDYLVKGAEKDKKKKTPKEMESASCFPPGS